MPDAQAGQDDDQEDWEEDEDEQLSSAASDGSSGKGNPAGTATVADVYLQHFGGGALLPKASPKQQMLMASGPLSSKAGPTSLSAGIVGGNSLKKAAASGYSENNPALANVLPSGFSGGIAGVPMKVVCRDANRPLPRVASDAFGQLKGTSFPKKQDGIFTREDFLSLEVRPALSAW